MSEKPEERILFSRPDPSLIRKAGYLSADMYVHTCHSDARPDIPAIIHHIKQKQIGVAITDHNEISGALAAINKSPQSLIIPGIELDSAEGPHILLYFYDHHDLADFFATTIRDQRKGKQYMERYLSVSDILTAAEQYSCLKVAAHPYGYFGLTRGALKWAEASRDTEIIRRFDAIETICGGMSTQLNRKTARYAIHNNLPITGGSDAHILRDIGNVVTMVEAESGEEFLDGIMQRRSRVIGLPADFLSRGVTAGVITGSFIPFTYTFLSARCRKWGMRLNGAIHTPGRNDKKEDDAPNLEQGREETRD